MIADISERDFNAVMGSPAFERLSSRIMLHCLHDKKPPEDAMHAFFSSAMRGAVPGSAKYDPERNRFTKIPKSPESTEQLGMALMGLMNSALDVAERK